MRGPNLANAAYLSKYLQLPQWQQWLVGIGIACLPALILCYLNILPEQEKQTQQQQERMMLTSQLQQLTLLHDTQPNIEEVNHDIEKLKQYILMKSRSDNEQHDFTKVITHYLNQTHCQLVLLKNLIPEQHKFFIIKQWQLKLTGNYAQFIQFMTLLVESGHLLTFKQFSLEKQNDRLNLTFIIQLHYAKPNSHE